MYFDGLCKYEHSLIAVENDIYLLLHTYMPKAEQRLVIEGQSYIYSPQAF